MTKEKKLIKQIRENPYILSTMVLGMLCVILIAGSLISYNDQIKGEINQGEIDPNICSKISGTPSWVFNNVIIGSGYTDFNKTNPNEVIDKLIKNRVYFIYNADCIYCEKQIELLNASWERYVESGLTINCKK